MIERYALVAGHIRRELAELEQVITRAARAMAAARRHPEDQDLYLDSAALSVHAFYAGLERIFRHIAAGVDKYVPTGGGWHRDLLQQMEVVLPGVRPQVLSAGTVRALEEYLRFRHVVRHVYAFNFDPERVERLVQKLGPAFEQTRLELLAFADLLEQLAREG